MYFLRKRAKSFPMMSLICIPVENINKPRRVVFLWT
nr:MAG TPA: hypothetical protein [Bacteriophage sp.]